MQPRPPLPVPQEDDTWNPVRGPRPLNLNMPTGLGWLPPKPSQEDAHLVVGLHVIVICLHVLHVNVVTYVIFLHIGEFTCKIIYM